MPSEDFDLTADVVVLGSGGAALTAAIAAKDFGANEVVVLEKSNMVGGTTAMSGGMTWVPNNHHQEEIGLKDSWDDVVTYLDSLAPDQLDPVVLYAFLTGGPEMVRHLADHTPVKFRALAGLPDYQPDFPGAKVDGGRSLDNDVFPFESLGNWATRVVPPKMGPPRRTSYHEDMNLGPLESEELAIRTQNDSRGRGQALIGALLRAALDRDISILFEHRAAQLIKQQDRIVGVIASTPKGEIRARAKRGVIIATGGFEWNKELVQTFLRGPMTGPVSVPECEGDGLLMAMEAGAKLGNMSNAFWMPSALEWQPQHRHATPNYLLCQHERTLPGSIMVNRVGQRFVDEAANYNALGMALLAFDANAHAYPNLPYFLIFDQRYREKYPVFGCKPDQPLSEMFTVADTLDSLAAKMDIEAAGLVNTIDRFNEHVRNGRDADFNRGANTYDNYWGDPEFDPPYKTLGVIDQAPFYAVKMESGVLGTNGGPKTNGHAQVLNWHDQPIDGLYAAGNVMAAPLAMIYGGGGGTLGPALTFGYLAGKHAACGQ
ncbi:MAG: FAD-dependent oxidoreductase, partial [Pseudomonadales bacterium]